jgi:hypothetical protein
MGLEASENLCAGFSNKNRATHSVKEVLHIRTGDVKKKCYKSEQMCNKTHSNFYDCQSELQPIFSDLNVEQGGIILSYAIHV